MSSAPKTQTTREKSATWFRYELFPRSADLDSAAHRIAGDFLREHPELSADDFEIATAKAYVIRFDDSLSSSDPTMAGKGFDSVLREILLNRALDSTEAPAVWNTFGTGAPDSLVIERRFRPGMTDNAGKTLAEALAIRFGDAEFDGAAHRLDLFRIHAKNPSVRAKLRAFLSHPLLHLTREFDSASWASRREASATATLFADFVSTPRADATSNTAVETFALGDADDDTLVRASRDRLWALSLAEMRAIQAHYATLGREPTIAEMEVLAQTWSEHCKHKIFRGTIRYTEERAEGSTAPAVTIPAETKNLFKTTIKAATDACPKPWLLSVFSDNAGIVAFTDDDAVCIKVETHNSPSAIDPFAGAITGIGGVHRDIIGTGFGAKPIFNLDVFCVAPAKFDADRPEGLLPPSRILEGVRAGVEAGGNPAGIPTVAGALVFDPSYLGKPLVYCGSAGVLPRTIADTASNGAVTLRDCAEKKIAPGDAIVMVGGRVGRDGIHGATFSSLAMDTGTAGGGKAASAVFSSVVQLGDPFTQKRALDFLLVARDRGLYRTLTDNGAGGLSSSVGELATLSNGADLDLTTTPLKALDLRPEEILVSESQERMTVAVPQENLVEFLELSTAMRVESTALGTFTGSGRFVVRYGDAKIADIDLAFLHDGCPDLEIRANWEEPRIESFAAVSDSGLPAGSARSLDVPSLKEALPALLASDNIRSKAGLIRQYDHEVQGCSLVKPETQSGERRSPNQAAAVLLSPTNPVAATVGVGILPEYSRYDAYTMAQASLDEAVRNVLCVGSEYGTEESVLALLDNFCWPDPVSNPRFAADLVRAGYGLRDAAMALGLPFVSGKDSMKNDFRGKTKTGEPVTISVLPTLLVTALGRIPEPSRARTSEFKSAGDLVYWLGGRDMSLVASQFEKIGFEHGEKRALPRADWKSARAIYSWLGSDHSRRLRSCADISEGGALVAIAEGLFAYHLGFEADPQWHPTSLTELFGEGFHGFIVSIDRELETETKHDWFTRNVPFVRLGTITERPELRLGKERWTTDELSTAWRGTPPSMGGAKR
jgi:phosphoribosylformylglycinamidine synthase